MKFTDWIILIAIVLGRDILKIALFAGIGVAIRRFGAHKRIHKAFTITAMGILAACLFWDTFAGLPKPKDVQLQATDLMPATDITAIDLIQRCLENYKALASYSVHGESVYSKDGKQWMVGTAQILFQRPDKLRIVGKGTRGFPFKVLMDGESLRASPFDADDESTVQRRRESAIASYTGISGSAATYVPAALMDLKWGALFSGNRDFDKRSWKLDGKGILNNRTVYQISESLDKSNEYRTVVWLDSKTYLIVQVRFEYGKGLHIVRYSGDQLNPALDERLFDVNEIRLRISSSPDASASPKT